MLKAYCAKCLYAFLNDNHVLCFTTKNVQIFHQVLLKSFEFKALLHDTKNPHAHLISKDIQTLRREVEKYFQIPDFFSRLLQLLILGRKFDHTNAMLTEVQEHLIVVNQMIANKHVSMLESDKKTFQSIIHQLWGQFKYRIVQLKLCFGVDTFAFSTHNYDDEDALGSLEKLLQCVDILCDLEKRASPHLKQTSDVIVTNWLRVRFCLQKQIVNLDLFENRNVSKNCIL